MGATPPLILLLSGLFAPRHYLKTRRPNVFLDNATRPKYDPQMLSSNVKKEILTVSLPFYIELNNNSLIS
ncbi:MAG: hypothetical protein ACI9E5_001215 [Candidatus Omnitrophota bacterium]|jgi:hypothetical protein